MMHRRAIATALVVALSIGASLSQQAQVAAAATVTVTTVADTPCAGPAGGLMSLRCAILTANADQSGDTIDFDINPKACSSSKSCIITPSSALPALTAAGTTIDGYTQPGSAPSSNTSFGKGDNAVIKVVIDGANLKGSPGLEISGSNDTVDGLAIIAFASGTGNDEGYAVEVDNAAGGANISGDSSGAISSAGIPPSPKKSPRVRVCSSAPLPVE